MNSFWASCLSRLEEELPPQQFNTWIKPLRVDGVDGGEQQIRLLAPNGFILKWVKERYLARIEEMSGEYFSTPVSVCLTLGERTPLPTPTATSENAAVAKAGPSNGETRAKTTSPVDKERSSYEKTRLISSFTFDNLVVGKANDLARAASRQVAISPGEATYNPLFIYGGAGLGKTHLVHAIGNQIVGAYPEKVVRYVHAEDYYSDVVRAYQQKSFDVFKRYYRSLDVLLLDDVQFFNGKNRTQEEFFFVFNSLIESRKQIVITCDTYPKNISGLEDRLITRFDWGLTVQIEPPETEMRVAILKNKAQIENVTLDEEVAFFIAKHLRSNVRELEGALKKVLAYSAFHGQTIGLELAKEALKDVIGSVNRQITVENIQKTVADYFKIKVSDLFSKKRTRQIVRPRQIAMWLAKQLTSLSYPAIGSAFGGRDHTTVLHAVRTIDELRSRDNELNHDVHVLLQVLKA
ncbi:MAG TPA: chromosomal replication initiator protein DnaA [Accumulibacter sp.]|uniref:chromosomal replication initiator protein DnaA n=1 Tax=Accumulibacter sp. TaxID=2053492 RepID=UPI002B727EA9|nr:chromosomal replication initiator protein DnaA [Accumulibacter sp.]HMV06969.1 chromosomal replication initiator protein DnaA [Accumulibacter sp.]HMW64254.1 chromosomal replication initiator protein DnaA [Accumulibacter sp.]HMW81814.1 chromosomal replication initiator protein DnaA [Accumulibacter sp.]HNB68653.1 chromosomal replication initiator protein DnaA [Accumulibacter sp.]HNC27929.1 chromosomal replication initiator protein DnaA [Accumulibacter sp.]